VGKPSTINVLRMTWRGIFASACVLGVAIAATMPIPGRAADPIVLTPPPPPRAADPVVLTPPPRVADAVVVMRADTIENALIQAYQNNPQLNAQRAIVRATDEGVPTALSGYRPRASITADVGYLYTDTLTLNRSQTTPAVTYNQTSGNVAPRGAAGTLTQTLYNGFQTGNRTRQAESQVFAARETLRRRDRAFGRL